MYGVYGYGFHLGEVSSVLKEFGACRDVVAAAWTHDLIEDTDVTREKLARKFNQRVADLTWAVSGEGETRREKLASVVVKIPLVEDSDLLKMADRYCNMKNCMKEMNIKKLKMYVGEYDLLSTVFRTDHPLRRLLDDLVEEARIVIASWPRPRSIA
jgi:(p)ppGpp synthase/HD superfamily hydrolase